MAIEAMLPRRPVQKWHQCSFSVVSSIVLAQYLTSTESTFCPVLKNGRRSRWRRRFRLSVGHVVDPVTGPNSFLKMPALSFEVLQQRMVVAAQSEGLYMVCRAICDEASEVFCSEDGFGSSDGTFGVVMTESRSNAVA